MADYPPAALRAAAEAIERDLMSGTIHDGHAESDEALARAALDAAAPLLAAEIASQILAHMERNAPPEGARASSWRRHFGIAARIAAGAFTTEDEQKRQAAEAIMRGDYIACAIPEDGGPRDE